MIYDILTLMPNGTPTGNAVRIDADGPDEAAQLRAEGVIPDAHLNRNVDGMEMLVIGPTADDGRLLGPFAPVSIMTYRFEAQGSRFVTKPVVR